MITVEQLGKRFPKKGQGKHFVQAIEDVSFSAADAQITGLLGSNGAGKSTTLRVLATLIQPDRGHASIDGFNVLKQPLEARKKIGFMPHDAGLYPRLTARENIQYYADLCGLSKNDSGKRINTLIAQLDMGDFADRRCDGFSQGQKTKTALARALVHGPQTLILDEPTNGLDVMATRNLRDILRGLKADGHCILISSHIMQEIAALCDHVAIISQGRIAIADSVPGILNRTGESDLEDAFVSAINASAISTSVASSEGA